MRVVVLGGTNFIGRRITEDLHARGDEVTVVHRGVTEPSGWLDCHHLHAARADFGRVAADVRALVPVPEAVLPGDMWPTKGQAQHLLFDSRRATDLLGWRTSDAGQAIARSVRWQLASPPPDADPDFTGDDKALGTGAAD
jgi:nucleoside-diphosphate-sugar epimerase